MSSSENPPPAAAPASEQSQSKQPDASIPVGHSPQKQEAPTDAQSKQGSKKGGSGWGLVIGIVLLGFAFGMGYYLYTKRNEEKEEKPVEQQ
ncbi:hypothetical protein NTE_03395 [Candidatus Nitrososphaera evergladensis SR1]|uniref:Uncharacterized protein n=1 Tax=Candidatus Nitrososphaera evergladensis SR1 TaxID=1459636 RepID=A0A075MWB1_9ARCH|nr:hypothetical protein [Candidatus Nitrososphaera evergladensis]AIF85423.1 hypothetical protein NTE_03395 [Candidatus Nitrososphaera evergladensis SR1]